MNNTRKPTVVRRRDTIPQELEDCEDVLVSPDSFVMDQEDEDEEEDHDDTPVSYPLQLQPRQSRQQTPSASSSQDWTTRMHRRLLEFPKEVRNLLAGGIAGMMAKTVVAPLDRIKILYQVSDVKYEIRKIPHVVRRIVDNEGASALWKGNLATMIRVFPYSGIQFMMYDRLKGIFLKRHESGQYMSFDQGKTSTSSHSPRTKFGLTPLESLVAGMTAGTISVMLTYPLDLTRAQLAVLRKHKNAAAEGPSKTFWTVLTDNYKMRGYPGLFRGMTPTLLGILPYSGIAFTLNEQGKREVRML